MSVAASVYSGGQNVGGNFHQISARKPVLLSFNTVFPYKNVGGQDLHRQNVGGNYPPQPPTWGVIINTGDNPPKSGFNSIANVLPRAQPGILLRDVGRLFENAPLGRQIFVHDNILKVRTLSVGKFELLKSK